MAVDLIFSFDCEDYITPESADAEAWWAQLMTRHGVRASLCVVGELARSLRERGRRDVLEAMADHEIASHSDGHSAPPQHAVYLEPLSWDEGVAAVIEREARGIRDLAETFGQWPAAYCKPGTSWGPPLAEAMRRMNVPVLCDAAFEWAPGQPLWYAGTLCLGYHFGYDDYYDLPEEERLPRMQADFDRLCGELDGGTLVVWTHPCCLVTRDFWDGVNFGAGRDTPREAWQPAPLRSPAAIAALKRDIDAFTAWALRRPDVRLTTYRDLTRQCAGPAGVWVNREDVLQLLREVGDPPGPVRLGGAWYSPAEILALACSTLARAAESGALPEAVPLRRPLGPTTAPATSTPALTTSPTALLAAARAADAAITDTGAIPASIPLGNTPVGPNTLLQTARDWPVRPDLKSRIQNRPSGEVAALANRPDFADFHFRGTWPIFPPDFEAPRLIEMARWQAWSAKPARRV